MSIDVTAPDGSSVSFPDGTPQDVITGALAKQFGAPKNVPRETETPSIPEGMVRAAASGVPIAGGLVNKAEAATNALLAPLLDRYLPDSMEKLPEGSFGERYRHALDIQNQKDASFAKAHGVLSTGAEIGGGLASVGGALKAAPKVASEVLGLTGKTLPQQVIRGATSGAALSGADTAVRGGDVGEGAEIGALMGAAAPVVGRAIGRGIEAARGLRRPAEVPQNITDIAGVPVRQSMGQATGDTEAISREQMALRGNDNSSEQAVARNYFDAQKDELGQARTAVAGQMHPTGEVVAGTPQEAAETLGTSIAGRQGQQFQTAQNSARALEANGEALRANLSPTRSVIAANPTEAAGIVSQAVGGAAEQAQQATRQAYAALRAMPGRFHPASFNTAADEIRTSLNRGTEPIKVNPQTTPIANSALDDLDEILGGRNTAPQQAGLAQTRNPESGRVEAKPPITPQVVEDTRKRLNSFYGDALSKARMTGDRSDSRAMRGIIDGFDDVVSNRLTDGRFIGGNGEDVAAALREARGLHSEYRRTFTSQGSGDAVGQAVSKIVGKFEGQAAPPEEIRGMLYGNGSLPVKIAQRFISTFGANSPQVGAIKQGLYSHLTEAPTGARFAPEKAADNIDKFLQGSTLSQIYLSPAERQAFADHAAQLRASVPRAPTGAEAILQRIGGQGGNPASPTDVANWLLSTKGSGQSIALVQKIKSEFGGDSREVAALKQGVWAKVSEPSGGPLDVGSRKVVKNLTDLLEGDGKPIAHALFSHPERELITAYRDLLDRITPPAGTVNYSNTASVLGKMVRGSLDTVFGALGGLHFGPLGIIAGAAGAAKGQKIVQDAIRATKVARSLYGTPQEAMATAALRDSMARLTSIGARAATPALAH